MTAAEGAGEIQGAGVRRGRAEHPVCGDVVQIDVRVDDGVITDVAWRASGCPACVAVAAAVPVAWRGAPFQHAPERLAARLQELGGLAVHERHAERLVLDALARAEPSS